MASNERIVVELNNDPLGSDVSERLDPELLRKVEGLPDSRNLKRGEVEELFCVNGRTLNRWVADGKLVGDSSGRYTYYSKSEVLKFCHEHPDLLNKAHGYSQLGDEGKQKIVSLVHAKKAAGESHAEVLRTVAGIVGRSVETIRVIFNQHCYDQIMEQPIEFMYSKEFKKKNADAKILAPIPESEGRIRQPKAPAGLPPYLASLYDVPLLTKDQEIHQFRKYNYLKYKASELRNKVDRKRISQKELNAIEGMLQESVVVKNHLISANLRLVVGVMKKYVNSSNDLFVMVSDGNVSLMKAVEKFDYTRGNKFSTYATWAKKNDKKRQYFNDTKQSERFRSGHDELLDISPDKRGDPDAAMSRQEEIQAELTDLMARVLSDREQIVLQRYFGLGTHEEEPMKEIAPRIGAGKSRVGQIKSRALKKLRLALTENGTEKLNEYIDGTAEFASNEEEGEMRESA